MQWKLVSKAMSYSFGGIVGLNLGCVFCKMITQIVADFIDDNDEKKEEDKDGKN